MGSPSTRRTTRSARSSETAGPGGEPLLSAEAVASALELARDAADSGLVPVTRRSRGAVVTERGPRHVSGCSVEIAAAPRLGVCAEHVALAAAVTEGIAPAAVAIWTAEGDTSPLPCGPCRQVLAELAPAAQVWLKVGGGPPRLLKVHELLPMPFGKDRLPGEGPTP